MNTVKTILTITMAIIVFSSCGKNGKTFDDEGKEYPEALFTLGEIATVELEIPEDVWKDITAKAADKDYYECSVIINGERFDRASIRTKGASSLDDVKLMKSDRYSFTLKLNKYEKGQAYHGLSKLLLNNNIWDATQMKDAIVYDMCRFIGLPAPLTNYACITLNGKLFGYYLMIEPVDKHFCRRNWPDEVTNIYKPYHNLAYTGEKMKDYSDISDFAKVKGGDASMKRVVEALRSVDEGKDIEEHVDVESVPLCKSLCAEQRHRTGYLESYRGAPSRGGGVGGLHAVLRPSQHPLLHQPLGIPCRRVLQRVSSRPQYA